MNENILELVEKLNRSLIFNDIEMLEIEKIKKELSVSLPKETIAIAQANPVLGDINSNAKKALKWIELANELNVGAIIFPELFLVGSPVGDYLNRYPLIVEENIEWLNVLATKTTSTKVIIGFVDKNETGFGQRYYNAMAILANGRIEKVVRQSIISSFAEFNNSRFFASSPVDTSAMTINLCNNKKIGIIIGEDFWNDKTFCKWSLSQIDPLKKLVDEQNPDILINCFSSISRTGKEQYRNNYLSNISKQYKKPVVYVNQVGSNDAYSFDGASRVYDKDGNLLCRAKSFEEQFLIFSLDDNFSNIAPLPNGLEKSISNSEFSLDYEHDLERTYLTVVQSIKDYFAKTGFKRAVLGLSGGLDSTVSVVLLVDALGAENVFGISMPSKITSSESKNDAKELAQNLGIGFMEIPIKSMFDATRMTFDNVFSDVEKSWECRYKESFTNDNIQARSRAMILWGVANEFSSCLPIATSDKSELYMGYATINGDMSGGFAPLADITKTKLFALARWLNKNRFQKNAIPESIIAKRPGAELAINPKTGKPLLAEEALMPYEFLDEIIWRVENLNQTMNEMLDVEFVYEKNMKKSGDNISKEQKQEWLQKFFRRMSTGFYKWTIMPPTPIVDACSINNHEYRHYIVASHINYQKTSFEQKMREISE